MTLLSNVRPPIILLLMPIILLLGAKIFRRLAACNVFVRLYSVNNNKKLDGAVTENGRLAYPPEKLAVTVRELP